MSDPKMPERIYAFRDHYENRWSCDDPRLENGVIDVDYETKYVGGDGVEYIRADLVRKMERTVRKLANISGVDLAEMAEDGWVVDLDD